jgi:hypothetical protein
MTEKLTLELAYQGDGAFRTARPFDYRLAQKQLGEGELIRVNVTRGRSSKQNRMFHALIQAALDNQVHGPMLETADHMKAYLLIRAGHCNETRIPLGKQSAKETMFVARRMSAFLRQHYDFCETAYDDARSELVLRVAKPWRFSKTDHETANSVMERVVSEIVTNIVPGVTPDELLNMAKSEAA